MRLDDYRESDNVGEGEGGGGGGLVGGGGLGGGGAGLLLGLIGSRFGIGGIIVIVIGMMLFGMNPLGLIGGGGGGGVQTAQAPHITQAGARKACAVDPAHKFSCQVLASTEDTWAKLFQAQGATYRPPSLILYNRSDVSGCGAAQSAMGPFYCPTDQRVYLDTSFFDELVNKFHAAGDFAQAYVIAHEVGHHVQYLTGIAAKVRQQQQQASETEGNALQVRMELQADCYAGVWAANAKDAHGQAAMEPGDAEEGMRAAAAIGDDTLQRSAGRTPMPDSFTHGTSAERQAWLKRGLDSGDPAKCDTFAGAIDI